MRHGRDSQPERSTAHAPPSDAPGLRGLSWAVTLAALGVVALLCWREYSAWLQTGIVSIPGDADPYMRYLRVIELTRTGDWFGVTIPRAHLGGPDALVWTRPLDVLILAPAWLLSFHMPMREAVLVGGSLLSPLFLVASIPLLMVALKPLELHPYGMLCAALAFACHPVVLAQFRFGRADHHALLMLCLIGFVGCFLRALARPPPRRACVASGALAGMGIWINPEFTLFAGLACLYLAATWWLREDGAARDLRSFGLGAVASIALASFAEHGARGFFAVEHDRVSLVHLALFAAVGAGGAAMGWLEAWSPSRVARGWALCALSLLGFVALELWFPGFYNGPAQAMDPELHGPWFERLEQSQGLFRLGTVGDIALVFAMVAYSVPTYLHARRLSDAAGQRRIDFLLLGVAATFALTLAFTRGAFFLAFFCIPPLGLWGAALWSWLAPGSRPVARRWERLARVAALQGFVLCCPLLAYLPGIAQAFSPMPPLSKTAAAHARRDPAYRACTDALHEWIQRGRVKALSGFDRALVLTRSNDAPALLFWTGHGALAWNNHRSTRGLMLHDQFFRATTEEALRDVVEQAAVDLVLYCPKRGHAGRLEPYWNSDHPRPLPAWLEVVAGDRSSPEPVLLRVRRADPGAPDS